MELIEDTNSNHLTNLYNLTYISEKYQEIQGTDSQYALMLLNVKHFRYFNTKYGYQAGDEILELLFQTALDFLDDDEFIARIYSDNFVLLMKCEDVDTFLANRWMVLIDNLYRIDDERIYRNIFSSYGLYLITNSDVAFLDALNYANLSRKECDALFNRCFSLETYNEFFHNRYMERLELEVATANAYKNYEFISYFQPKIDLSTGKISGAETLLRWFDKDGHPVPLNEFLPILTQNSYIIIVDLDIFDRVCQQLDERIKKQQPVVPISFNISKPSFYRPNILQDYTTIFEKYEIPKHLIEIEFMESISLDNTARMKEIIKGFKDYGFTCSLDDFGNGYSSFGVLLNAPFDHIKMDRQFFLNNLNGDSKLVIKTIIELIHSLGMKVIAEGVELEEHIDILKKFGCNYVQGYYYYKPMSFHDFIDLLENGH